MPILVREMGDAFPELKQQEAQITRIIESEEKSFLNTLENGLTRFANLEATDGQIGGQDVFELYDTFGFPIDLTRLLASEQGLTIDEAGFETALAEQKARSRKDAAKEVGDWTVLSDEDSVFIGYDYLSDSGAKITKFRTVKVKDKPQYHVVLDRTPFYGESGGQAGDTGSLKVGDETIYVTDTVKENDLTVHIVNKLPAEEELKQIEALVNEKVRQNIALIERRDVPIAEARNSGAMMLFGEKYGDAVRIITFDAGFSSELCGGTHVQYTGELGLVKITGESSVAAGIRRIEAVTGEAALKYVDERLAALAEIRELVKGSSNPVKSVASLQDENRALKKELEKMQAAQAGNVKGDLEAAFEEVGGVNFLAAKVPLSDAAAIKSLAFQLTGERENATWRTRENSTPAP